MTEEQLKKEIKTLNENHKKLKSELYIKFAKENNPYKIGDIISDGYGTIKIEKVGVGITFGNPYCIYSGPKLKKDLTPFKSNEKENIYQSKKVRKLN